MKRALLIVMMFGTAVSAARGLTLADARAKIADAVKDPATMAATMKVLDAGDQVKFLADVNAAIAAMPGSNEAKAAKFLNANRTALQSAKKGNLTVLLAEVFATVPPEALTVINERFAADLFNRAADPSKTLSDEQFVTVAIDKVKAISARAATGDDAAVRTTFAILMFLRASNGTPVDLCDKLVAELDSSVRDLAKDEWIPSALGQGREQSYAPMLGAADAGLQPNHDLVLKIAGPQMLDALLSELGGVFIDVHNPTRAINAPIQDDGGLDAGLDRVPFYANRRVIGTGRGVRGDDRVIGDGPVTAGPNGAYYIYPSGNVVYFPPGTKIAPGGTPWPINKRREPTPEPKPYSGQEI